MSSYAHDVHTTAKQVISRRRKNENVYKMSKNEKCRCKAGKNTVFHCQICKYVGFLLPSSSWLLKLPIYHLISNARSWNNHRLTHSASELLGFTCKSSLTMNEKFQYRTRPPSVIIMIMTSRRLLRHNPGSVNVRLHIFSINLLVVYRESVNLIGYITRRLSADSLQLWIANENRSPIYSDQSRSFKF